LRSVAGSKTIQSQRAPRRRPPLASRRDRFWLSNSGSVTAILRPRRSALSP
jgi:hypothetical protein